MEATMKPTKITDSSSDSFQNNSSVYTSSEKFKRINNTRKNADLMVDNPKPNSKNSKMSTSVTKKRETNIEVIGNSTSNYSNSQVSNGTPISAKTTPKRSKSQTNQRNYSLIEKSNGKFKDPHRIQDSDLPKMKTDESNNSEYSLNKKSPQKLKRSSSVSSRKSKKSSSLRSSSVSTPNTKLKESSSLARNKKHNFEENDEKDSVPSNSSFHLILQPLSETTDTYENTENGILKEIVSLPDNNDNSYTYITIPSSIEHSANPFEMNQKYSNNAINDEVQSSDKLQSLNSRTLSSEYTYAYLEDTNPSSTYTYTYITLDSDKFLKGTDSSSYMYIEIPSSSSENNRILRNANFIQRPSKDSESNKKFSQNGPKSHSFTIEKQETIVIDSTVQQAPRRKNARKPKNAKSRRKQNVLKKINQLEAQLDELQSTTSVWNTESASESTEDPIISNLKLKLACTAGKAMEKPLASLKDKGDSNNNVDNDSAKIKRTQKLRKKRKKNLIQQDPYAYSKEYNSQYDAGNNSRNIPNNLSSIEEMHGNNNISNIINSSKLMNSDIHDAATKDHQKVKKKVKRIIQIRRFKGENGSDHANKEVLNISTNKDRGTEINVKDTSKETMGNRCANEIGINNGKTENNTEIMVRERNINTENEERKPEKKMKKIIRRSKVMKSQKKASSPPISTMKSPSSSRRNRSLPRTLPKHDLITQLNEHPQVKKKNASQHEQIDDNELNLMAANDYVKVVIIEDSNFPNIQRYCVLYIEGQEKSAKQTNLISDANDSKYLSVFEYYLPKTASASSKLHILVKKQDLIKGDRIWGAIKIDLFSLPINETINKWIPISTGTGLMTTSKLHVAIRRMENTQSSHSFNILNSIKSPVKNGKRLIEQGAHQNKDPPLPDICPRNCQTLKKVDQNCILEIDNQDAHSAQNELELLSEDDDDENKDLSSFETISEDEETINKKIDRRFGVLKPSHQFEFNQEDKTIYN